MNFDSYKQLILDRLRSICERIKENPLANLLKLGDLRIRSSLFNGLVRINTLPANLINFQAKTQNAC